MRRRPAIQYAIASLHGHVPGDLLHPLLVRVDVDSGDGGGKLTAAFRLRFGNPVRDAERQTASHHREQQNPHERKMQTVL